MVGLLHDFSVFVVFVTPSNPLVVIFAAQSCLAAPMYLGPRIWQKRVHLSGKSREKVGNASFLPAFLSLGFVNLFVGIYLENIFF